MQVYVEVTFGQIGSTDGKRTNSRIWVAQSYSFSQISLRSCNSYNAISNTMCMIASLHRKDQIKWDLGAIACLKVAKPVAGTAAASTRF